MLAYVNLEDILPDFDAYPSSHDESFEDTYLKPRLQLLHPEATMIRFAGGNQNPETGTFTNRTVQAWKGTSLIRTYKYGRTR